MERIEALAKFLGVGVDDLQEELHNYQDNMFSDLEGNEYLVLTDDEADQVAADYIRESLWAFNAGFICHYMPNGIGPDEVEAIRGDRCESANSAFEALVGDNIDDLIEDAISADGRAHFMNTYDGQENKQDGYFIYRM